MNLLLDEAQVMQFEAYRLFLIIVKERDTYPPIKQILKKNQDSLIEFFHTFQCERDEQDFHETKQILITHLKFL